MIEIPISTVPSQTPASPAAPMVVQTLPPVQTVPMTMTSTQTPKGSMKVVIGVYILASFLLGFAAGDLFVTKKTASVSSVVPSPSTTISQVGTLPSPDASGAPAATADMVNYSRSAWNFEMHYPKEWHVDEQLDNSATFSVKSAGSTKVVLLTYYPEKNTTSLTAPAQMISGLEQAFQAKHPSLTFSSIQSDQLELANGSTVSEAVAKSVTPDSDIQAMLIVVMKHPVTNAYYSFVYSSTVPLTAVDSQEIKDWLNSLVIN